MSYLRMLAWGMVDGTPELLPMVNEELRELKATEVSVQLDPHSHKTLVYEVLYSQTGRVSEDLGQLCRFVIQYTTGEPLCSERDIEYLAVRLELRKRWGDALHDPSTVADHRGMGLPDGVTG